MPFVRWSPIYGVHPLGCRSSLTRRRYAAASIFTLVTTLGHIDLLGEIAGGGTYQNLLPHSVTLALFGIECQCLELKHLIHVKRAAGRPKDFEAIAELEALLEEQGGEERGGD